MTHLAAILAVALLGSSPTLDSEFSLFHVTKDKTIWGDGKNSHALDLLLNKGEFVFVDFNPGDIPWMVTSGVLINAPPERVYSIITDFRKYTEFMPQVDKVKQVTPADGLPEVNYTLGFRFAYIIPLTFSYTLKYLPRPPLRIDWVGIKEGAACHYGFWELVPLEGGKKTAAFYSLYSTPQWSLFKKIVEKNPHLLVSTVLSTALIVGEKIKMRAEGGHSINPNHDGRLSESDFNGDGGNGLEALASQGSFIIIEEPDEKGRRFVTGGTLIHAPPEKVWESITDLNAAPFIFPEVEKASVVGEDHGGTLVRFNLKVNYILYSKRLSYVFRHVPDKPRTLSWTWVEGDAKDTEGSWDLIPVSGGGSTLALYRLYSDLKGSSVFARYILTRQPSFEMAIQGSTVSVVVKGIRTWTEMTSEERARVKKSRRAKGSNGERSAIPGY